MLLKNRFVASVAVVALASVIGAAGVAQAQTTSDTSTPPAAKKPPKDDSTAVEGLVITGSRIKKTNYNSPEPITQITAEQAALTGAVDTAQILQLSSVAANNVQINNNFSGFVVNGGGGVNTLSLRGLGAQRTLILIDGQRLGPAGTSGAVGAVDLNVIPASLVDRIDIDNTGASSIYGSDAVAGVVNIITKKNLDGGNIQVHGEASQQGGGDVFQVNGNFGHTFDRGYFTSAFDYYEQDALQYGQRSYFSCNKDLTTIPGTDTGADLTDPATGKPKCQNLDVTPSIIDFEPSSGFAELIYRPNAGSTLGGGITNQDFPGWQAVGLNNGNQLLTATVPLTQAQILASAALIPTTPNLYDRQTAVSPDKRFSFSVQGGLDLSPHNQVYGSFMFNDRQSSQNLTAQFFGLANHTNPQNTAGFSNPEPVIPEAEDASQHVDYYRFVAGIKGDVPSFASFTNWTYNVFGQASISDATYAQTYTPLDRANAVLNYGAGSPGPVGCDQSAITEPGVSCVPFNLYSDVERGGFTPAEKNFLLQTATGRTLYQQYYVEGSTSGDLLQLPAGPLGASVGFHLRSESLDDKPPADFADGNVYNFSTEGETKGSETVQEVFGELNIPAIKGLPFIQDLTFELSGRVSNYSNYGRNETYKAGFDWVMTDWLTFRGTYGTAFRAPALFEQFLANQSGFLGQMSIDPCINYGSSGVNATIQANCKAQGIPANYGGNNPSAQEFTGGGRNLKPETSINNTLGIVLQPKWFGLNLKASVTYYTFDIKNQIQQFGAANIITQCYDSPGLTSPFCGLFTRDLTAGSPTQNAILTVNNDYVNVAEQFDQGLDAEITYVTHIGDDYKLTVDSNLAWTFYNNTILLGGSVNNFLGQVGEPAFNGNINFRLDKGPWTLNYYLYAIGKSSDNDFVPNEINYFASGETVALNHQVPLYTNSDISVRRKFDKASVTVGIKNLYDTPPPYYSTSGFQNRIGQTPLASQYDWIGRTFYLTVNKQF